MSWSSASLALLYWLAHWVCSLPFSVGAPLPSCTSHPPSFRLHVHRGRHLLPWILGGQDGVHVVALALVCLVCVRCAHGQYVALLVCPRLLCSRSTFCRAVLVKSCSRSWGSRRMRDGRRLLHLQLLLGQRINCLCQGISMIRLSFQPALGVAVVPLCGLSDAYPSLLWPAQYYMFCNSSMPYENVQVDGQNLYISANASYYEALAKNNTVRSLRSRTISSAPPPPFPDC
jgi:hypothetical protein